MASITASLANLVSFGAGITGIQGSYDLKTFYDAPANGAPTTPCLLTVLNLEAAGDWKTIAFQGNAASIDFTLDQYLLYKTVADNADITILMPGLISAIDTYFAALVANPLITVNGVPATHISPKVAWKILRSKWGEQQYHGALIQYQVRLNL